STVQKPTARLAAATNVYMARAVAEGRFREALYYRLSTVTISIPPLRDRGADISLLARKFAADFAERYTMPRISFDESARQLMQAYRWPGNVRQLKNVVEQIALFHAGDSIDSAIVRPYLPGNGVGLATVPSPSMPHDYAAEREQLLGMIMHLQRRIDALQERLDRDESMHHDAPFVDAPFVDAADEASDTKSLVRFEPFCSPLPVSGRRQVENIDDVSPATLEETERETIRRALERNGGRRKATAAELNISERTLYRKIKEYGME
ncbi:MAG: sigma 54-interacting transcriptional regulator, partial [Duncaniella sp.]|nr:sigma 54-interacting transcriptional regulator [Duncaniella sp.]